jgi:hypothetical protein
MGMQQRKSAPAESDLPRVLVFLLLVALIAFHPLARCTMQVIAGNEPSAPRECWTDQPGTILCLDASGQPYRAR